MPALVNSKVGSSPGTRLLLGTTSWPRLRKNSRNWLRKSALLVMIFFLSSARPASARLMPVSCHPSSPRVSAPPCNRVPEKTVSDARVERIHPHGRNACPVHGRATPTKQHETTRDKQRRPPHTPRVRAI